MSPFGSSGPTGLSPSAVRHAYGFDQVSFNGAAGNGAGTTIAIVDAYDDPSIASDLHAFDLQFGLPDPTFTKVNQTGGSTLPTADTGWAAEISLDVEWAHAIAPAANILLVEANSSGNDLFSAVGYAAQQPGVVAVSTSWGGGEFSSEASVDSTFSTPSGHTGVVFVASSGDSGAPISYPAASPNVLSVGGTSLYLNSSGGYSSESGWGGSGGGISAYESQPAYQKGVVTQSTTMRTNPDVSYDADPGTGFSVYQTYGNSTTAPWLQYGGTSAGAPQWAALIAIADQGRAAAGEAALSSSTLLPAIYQLPSADFHDVTTGTSTGSPNESAGPGYDLVTGRGSPVANKVIADLVGSSTTTTPTSTHFSVSLPSAATAGTSFSVTVTALDASNNVVPGFTGTVHFTSTDGLAALPADYTFTAADKGAHSFTVTLKTAGSKSVTVTSGSLSGSGSTTVNPGAPTHLAFKQQPTSAVAGLAISPAVTVTELDAYGNVATQDSTTAITLALGSNPGGATLTGGAVTVSHGVATFSGLSLSKAGTGYTLVASAGTLTQATSAAFNVTTVSSNVLEAFDNGLSNYYYTGSSTPQVSVTSSAAHDGSYGLHDVGDNNWYMRTDSAAQLNPGDTVSVWMRFDGIANGRAFFGFGTTTSGTLSAALAPNTNQFIIQTTPGFGNYTYLASGAQSYLADHWYRVEVAWGTSGTVTARLYDSDGQTLLKSLTAATGDTTPGGFAFRATQSAKDWDTVTVTRGINAFAIPQLPPTPPTTTTTATGHPALTAAIETGNWWTVLSSLPTTSSPAGTRSGTQTADEPWTFLAPSISADPWAEELLGGVLHRARV